MNLQIALQNCCYHFPGIGMSDCNNFHQIWISWEKTINDFFVQCSLIHYVRVRHVCVSKICVISPSQYLYQCWNIVDWTLGTKLQWNFNRNQYVFIQENAFDNVICKMLSISSRPPSVNASVCWLIMAVSGNDYQVFAVFDDLIQLW